MTSLRTDIRLKKKSHFLKEFTATDYMLLSFSMQISCYPVLKKLSVNKFGFNVIYVFF